MRHGCDSFVTSTGRAQSLRAIVRVNKKSLRATRGGNVERFPGAPSGAIHPLVRLASPPATRSPALIGRPARGAHARRCLETAADSCPRCIWERILASIANRFRAVLAVQLD